MKRMAAFLLLVMALFVLMMAFELTLGFHPRPYQ